MTKTEMTARLTFRRAALEKLYDAYLALVSGGVKSYTIDDRQLTRFDLDRLKNEIDELEHEISELEAIANGGAARRAFGVVIRDW